MQLALRDSSHGPFLTKVIMHGLAQQSLNAAQLEQIKSKAVLMSLKFADKFYNKYKMDLLEQAAHDIIGVASLGLGELAEQDIDRALQLLAGADGIVKAFQKGWSMLSQVSLHNSGLEAPNKSLYGEVDAQLLSSISTPPDAEHWLGLSYYQQAQQKWQYSKAISVIKQTFFQQANLDDSEPFNLEGMLAEVLIYRLCCKSEKVKPDLKVRLKNIELLDEWFDAEFLQLQTQALLGLLPADVVTVARADLSASFIQQLINTLQFAKRYQKLLLENASPERRDTFEYKQGMKTPLLGWPQYIEM